MSSKQTYLFIIIFFVIAAILFGLWSLRNKTGQHSKIQNSLLLEEFARAVPAKSQPSQGGFLPEPPKEALKKAEQFIKNRLKTEAKITYQLTEELGLENKEKYNYEVIAYVSPQPFKWRIDLNTHIKEEDLRYIYMNNGDSYFVCNSESKTCTSFFSFSDPQFSTPLFLTNFLNTVLDPLQLKKFIGGTEESRQAKIGSSCTSGADEYGTMEICIDQKTGLLLSMDVRTKFRYYGLKSQRIETSIISSEVFSPPYPREPQN